MKKLGFTLIELLIVITIVGILISVATASYLTALKQSRDTKRKTDLEQIRQALETYRSENGFYPVDTATLTTGGFISVVPQDPKVNSGNPDYSYVPSSPATSYDLCTALEIIPSNTNVGSCDSTLYNYRLMNP